MSNGILHELTLVDAPRSYNELRKNSYIFKRLFSVYDSFRCVQLEANNGEEEEGLIETFPFVTDA